MAGIAAEVLLARAADWGFDSILGRPGDGIRGGTEELRTNPEVRTLTGSQTCCPTVLRREHRACGLQGRLEHG